MGDVERSLREPERQYTVDEAATILRLTSRSVTRHIRAGHIVASRVGGQGQWRIGASEITRLLAPCRGRPGPHRRMAVVGEP